MAFPPSTDVCRTTRVSCGSRTATLPNGAAGWLPRAVGTVAVGRTAVRCRQRYQPSPALLMGPRRRQTDTERHFSLTTGSSPWSFWRRRVPRQSASALGPHVVHRPSKALEGYSPFKTTDLRDPVLGKITERQGVTPAQVVIRAHRPRSRRDPKVRFAGAHRQQLRRLRFRPRRRGAPPNRWPVGTRVR